MVDYIVPGEDIYDIVLDEIDHRTNSDVLYFTAYGYGQYGTPWQQVGDHYFCTK